MSIWPAFIGNVDPIAVAAFSVGVELLGIAAAMEAIMKTRTSPGQIAWTLSLVLMPTLVLPIYLVFGRRKFRGYRKARRLGNSPMQELAAALGAQLQPHLATPPAPLAVLERIAQMPFTAGNAPTLLVNGNAAFAALFEAIEGARDYVLLEYYIVRDDTLGSALADLLLRKVRDGVRVLFLYDEVGCYQLGRTYIQRLQAGGIEFRSFHTTKGRRNRFQLNFRNHRKIAVVDGHFGMVGGMNIGDEYLDRHQVLTPWRDTNLALRGPAVQCLQLTFLEDWYWACEQIPALNWEPPAPRADGVPTLVIPTGPADSQETCVLSVLHLIHSAQRRLWIVSPYFVPDPAVIAALQIAAMRGVDVRVLLPEKPDRRLVWLSSFQYVEEVQSCGVAVYRYSAGFLHQKVWLIDDDWTLVGTTNLDNRSFRLNFEVGVLTLDAAFARQIEAMLEDDFARSRLLDPNQLAGRRLWFRLAVRCAHLLAPIQ